MAAILSWPQCVKGKDMGQIDQHQQNAKHVPNSANVLLYTVL